MSFSEEANCAMAHHPTLTEDRLSLANQRRISWPALSRRRRSSWSQLCVLSLAVFSLRNPGVNCQEHQTTKGDSINTKHHEASHFRGKQAAGSRIAFRKQYDYFGGNQFSRQPNSLVHRKLSAPSHHWPMKLIKESPLKPFSDGDTWSRQPDGHSKWPNDPLIESISRPPCRLEWSPTVDSTAMPRHQHSKRQSPTTATATTGNQQSQDMVSGNCSPGGLVSFASVTRGPYGSSFTLPLCKCVIRLVSSKS